MGKVYPKDREMQSAKQKRRLKSKSNRYLRPGALAQLRYSKVSAAKSSTDIGRKTIGMKSFDRTSVDVVENKLTDKSPNILSPVRFGFGTPLESSSSTPILSPKQLEISPFHEPLDLFKQNRFLNTPKTPRDGEYGSVSRLESLPMDLLVKIMCHLHHDQLRAVFHVSQKIRKAVIQARHFYFNFTTPDRSRQEMSSIMTPRPTDHWPFLRKGDEKSTRLPSPHTPKAPKHGPRPPSRVKFTEIRQISAVLFKEPAFPSRCMVPSVLQKPLCKSLASNRVLFYEDELCKAVAQNKLR